jgi:hypothetical protein
MADVQLFAPELLYYERRPELGIIRIINKAKVSRQFNSIVHSLEFGSVTITIRINGSPVPGLTNLIPGTTPFRAVATGGNILEVDKSLEIILSRVSMPKGLSLQFEYDWII